MAMSFIAKPTGFHPAYNTAKFIVDSTNKNNTAFEYIFQVFESGTSNEIGNYAVKPRFGDGYGEIDLSELLSAKLTSEIGNADATSFYDALHSYYKYDVKIGERYIVSTAYTSALTNSGGYVRVNVTHSYSLGDQVYITQADGGTANPQVEGYQTITAVGVGYFVINVLWSTVTDANIDGSIKYADNRRTSTLNVINDLNKYVFNGVFDTLGEVNYTPNTYDLNSVNDKALTVLPTSGYMIAKSAPLVLNFRTQSSGSGSIRFANSNGDVLELGMIATTQVTAVNCGTYNLPTLSVVSGSNPLVKPTTEWYDVYYWDASQKSVKYRVNINQDCEIEPYSLLFVDQLGSLISLPFTLKARELMDVKRDTFNRDLKGQVTGGQWKPLVIEGSITQVNSSQAKRLELNSPYVSDEMSELYYQLHASPSVILFNGSNYIPCVLENNSVQLKRRITDKLVQYSVTIRYSNNEKING